MKYFNSKNIIYFLFVFFYQLVAVPQTNHTKLLDEYLSEYIVIKNVPSISAGILKDGEILWVNGIGKADIENNVSISNSSLYRIASISTNYSSCSFATLGKWTYKS